MLPLIALISVLEPVRQRTKILNRKTYDFSLSSVRFLIFHKNVHPTTVSESESVSESELFFRIRIQPKHSNYFGFGSATLVPATFTNASDVMMLWLTYPMAEADMPLLERGQECEGATHTASI
jgi:hypothetical protein